MTDLDWGEFRRNADENTLLEIAEIKTQLPISYVLHAYGIEATEEGGRVVARCPFHDDSDPSFDVFGENLERWGCYPCGVKGDVLDFIKKFEGTDDFMELRRIGTQLVRRKMSDNWSGPTKGKPKAELDVQGVLDLTTKAYEGANLDTLQALCDLKGFPFDAGWLHETFFVGTWLDWITFPYLDAAGNFRTMKHRTLTERPKAAEGSQFGDLLYNIWRDDGSKPVLLCEGESDAWVAEFKLGREYAVLAVPTGAGDVPRQSILLSGRKVVIAFDGDDAGRAGAARWFQSLVEHGCEVSIAPVPDGQDLASCGDVARIVALATAIRTEAPSGLVETDAGYARPGAKENTPLSNFTFAPTRHLVGESFSAFEGHIMPGHVEAVLSSMDVASDAKMIAWATRYGRAWYGSKRDAQLVLGLLQSMSPFLAQGKMTTVVGHHDGHFVWPGGVIGPDYWKYVKPPADVHLANMMDVAPGDFSAVQIHVLRKLHRRDIMDPLLAWLAAAPLRSLLHEFPILAVTGPSGSGKTTLTETVVNAFSGTSISNNLTSTTRFALFGFIGSTNAFPVHFDEFRPGARKDTLITLEQLLRDAYTQQPSSMGGMKEHWAEVTTVPTSAPIIVTGEDTFSEVSHTERMVLLGISKRGRDSTVLREVRSWGNTGLAYDYLTYLQAGLADGSITPSNFSAGPATLGPRPRLNMGVLELGWDLLNDYLLSRNVDPLGEPDWSLVTSEAVEAARHTPIEDAIRWALGEGEAAHFMFHRKGHVYLRIENLVQFIGRTGTFKLPGGVTAIRKYLQAEYDAREDPSVDLGGIKKSMTVISDRILK